MKEYFARKSGWAVFAGCGKRARRSSPMLSMGLALGVLGWWAPSSAQAQSGCDLSLILNQAGLGGNPVIESIIDSSIKVSNDGSFALEIRDASPGDGVNPDIRGLDFYPACGNSTNDTPPTPCTVDEGLGQQPAFVAVNDGTILPMDPTNTCLVGEQQKPCYTTCASPVQVRLTDVPGTPPPNPGEKVEFIFTSGLTLPVGSECEIFFPVQVGGPGIIPPENLIFQQANTAGLCNNGALNASGSGSAAFVLSNVVVAVDAALECNEQAPDFTYPLTVTNPVPPQTPNAGVLVDCTVTSPGASCDGQVLPDIGPGQSEAIDCVSSDPAISAEVSCGIEDQQGTPQAGTLGARADAECSECDIQLDRQVSCDGGVTWVDAGPGGTALFDDEPFIGICGTTTTGLVKVRWVAVNNSFIGNEVAAVDCNLIDGNPFFTNVVEMAGMPPSGTPAVIAMTDLNQCIDVLDGEANGVTAMLSCDCLDDQGEAFGSDSDEDTAGFMCSMLPPAVELDKECVDESPEGTFNYTLQVTNPSGPDGAPIGNCVISDPDSSCDGLQVAGPLLPGQSSALLPCTSSGRMNTASVTCEGLGLDQQPTGDMVTDEDTAECCFAEVDKQVSCDGGYSWNDVGFGDNVAESCTGWTTGDPEVKFRYLGRTNFDAICTLTDSNGAIVVVPGPYGLTGGAPPSVLFETDVLECNSTLLQGEPDTATLSCECSGPEGPAGSDTDTDSADLECRTPGVDVIKECTSNNGDGTYTYGVKVTNTGDALLENCRLNDPLAGCEELSQTSLTAGEMATAQCTGESNMNMVGVTCDIAGTSAPIDPCLDLVLQDDTVTGLEAYTTCGHLTAGPSYAVTGPGGDLTLTAGNAVVLAGGFEVGVDATFTAGTDPALGRSPKTVSAEAMDGCVDLDKQISCDGGVTFVDLGYNDSLAESCIGWSGTDPSAAEIVFRYRARTGVAMTQCVLEDTNTAVLAAPVAIGDLAAKYDDFIYQTPLPLFCDAVEPWEPDTATLNCISTESGVMVTDDDSADLECQAPAVELDKVCVGEEPAGTFNYTLQVTNPAGVKRATIANCVVSDPDSSCDGAQFAGPFTPGQTSTPIDCTSQSALNTASVTCDILNEDLQTTGKTISDEDTAECLCEIKVDKQISCSSGWSFVDTGFDDGVEESCVGWLGQDEIVYRYEVVNTGTVGVSSCTLVDTNSAVGAAGVIPISDALQPGETASHDNPLLECGTALAGGEPDTALFTCSCAGFEDRRVSSSDSADLECRTADLAVTKTCEQQVDNENHVTITYENVGDANLVNCVVVDEVFLDDPECPADVGSPSPIPMSPASGIDLAPGQGGTSTGVVFDLAVDACNRVTVTCEIEGALDETGQVKTITETADDLCMPQRAGCYSRTPGFWGTHPRVTELFLPVASCGLPIDNTGVETPGSAIEDMCWDGTDAAANDTSPQQLQLIRQCTAAALNLAVTAEAGGSCEREFPGISEAYQECCASLCTTGLPGQTIGDSGCIQIIDAFNNSVDSLSCDGPNPLPYPFCPGLGANGFPAEPDLCTQAGGNGFVNPGRNLGPM